MGALKGKGGASIVIMRLLCGWKIRKITKKVLHK